MELWRMVNLIDREGFQDQPAAKLVDPDNFRGLVRCYQRRRAAGTLPKEAPISQAVRNNINQVFDDREEKERRRQMVKPLLKKCRELGAKVDDYVAAKDLVAGAKRAFELAEEKRSDLASEEVKAPSRAKALAALRKRLAEADALEAQAIAQKKAAETLLGRAVDISPTRIKRRVGLSDELLAILTGR